MNFSLENLLVYYLKLNQRLSLLGIGEFIVQEVRSDFQYSDSSIHPPFSTISFDGNRIEGSFSFIEFVSDKMEISSEEASAMVEKFSDQLSKELLEGKAVGINGIGILQKSDHNTIELDAGSTNFHSIYGGLPSVLAPNLSLHQVHRTNEPQEEVQTTKKINTTNKDLAHMANQYDPQQEIYQNKPSQNSLWRAILWPLILLIGVILLSGILLKQCSQFIADHPIPDEIINVDSIGTVTAGVDGIVPDLDSLELSKLFEGAKYDAEKYRDILTPEIIKKGCIVVVGSFKKSKFADRMERKIITKGYQPYREQNGDFHRVGVLFHCLDHDLVEFIMNIRQEFNQKSWFLVPQLEVPYQ